MSWRAPLGWWYRAGRSSGFARVVMARAQKCSGAANSGPDHSVAGTSRAVHSKDVTERVRKLSGSPSSLQAALQADGIINCGQTTARSIGSSRCERVALSASETSTPGRADQVAAQAIARLLHFDELLSAGISAVEVPLDLAHEGGNSTARRGPRRRSPAARNRPPSPLPVEANSNSRACRIMKPRPSLESA